MVNQIITCDICGKGIDTVTYQAVFSHVNGHVVDKKDICGTCWKKALMAFNDYAKIELYDEKGTSDAAIQ